MSTTPVIFRRDGEEIVAVFPSAHEGHGTVMCYAHVGQQGWYVRTKAAAPTEYANLKAELEAAPYHYQLRVLKRWPARV